MRSKVIGIAAVGLLVALIGVGVSVGQPQGRTGRQDGQRSGQRGMFNPERMRQMMTQRMKEQLGASDEEWQVLGPRLTKVMTLTRQAQPAMGRGRRGPQGGQGGPQGDQSRGPQGDQSRGPQGDRPRGSFGQEETAVSKAGDALQTTLENASASSDEIKAKLTALRTAKEKATQDLAAAQKELREVLTLRQEAQLVLMGMLN